MNLENSLIRGSSYVRTLKKESTEFGEKRALGELYNFIKFKFSSNLTKENDLEGNFHINLSIPYHVKILIYLN